MPVLNMLQTKPTAQGTAASGMKMS